MSPEQREEAIKLRQSGLGWRTIAQMIGSTRWHLIKELDPVQHKKNQMRSIRFYYENRRTGSGVHGDMRMIVPDEVQADRERRQNLPQSIFGDPPPGYSALDKKRNEQTSA